jgi:hypothetical protein
MLVFKLVIQGCNDMKPIVILWAALFLASAPSPDSNTIVQLSGGFLSPDNAQPLLAAEPGQTFNRETAVTSETVVEEIPAD